MAYKRKGHLTVSGEWARHLRPLLHRVYWKAERQAGRAQARQEGNEAISSPPAETAEDTKSARR